MKKEVFYMCDPARSTNCKKRMCRYKPGLKFPTEYCDTTKDPDHALRDIHGNPIVDINKQERFADMFRKKE